MTDVVVSFDCNSRLRFYQTYRSKTYSKALYSTILVIIESAQLLFQPECFALHFIALLLICETCSRNFL